MPLLEPPIDYSTAPTDDDLCGLLDAVRRYIRDAPAGMWSSDTLQAARVVSVAVSRCLAEGGGRRG